jgi:hypothetical protein
MKVSPRSVESPNSPLKNTKYDLSARELLDRVEIEEEGVGGRRLD